MRGLLIAAVALLASPAAQAETPAGMTVERVVLLMRHGVRPPTKDPALPAGMAAAVWPRWDVAFGWLTPHGARAVTILGESDRRRFVQQGLLAATGCPAAGTIAISSDSDERTIATGDAYVAALAPGCGIANRHRPQDEADPLFHEGAAGLSPDRATAVALAATGAGGIAGAATRAEPALATVNRVLCGDAKSGCGLPTSSGLRPATEGGRPKLSGALDYGSTAAQALLLEYADGKPMAEVGWGHASAADIAQVSALHAEEFAVLARPPVLAWATSGAIVAALKAALTDERVRLTVVVGHDTNVANLAGLLDVHWSVPGFATDDPSPGGALGLEVLRDRTGGRFVRVFYRSQTLDEIRGLAPGAGAVAYLPQPRCGGRTVCPLAEVLATLAAPTG